MTLDEAIGHCIEKGNECTECGKEHLQLAKWLNELKKYKSEANKILMTCCKPCHMGKDIKLIEREYNLGHELYGEILAQYEQQIKDCPKICPRYKIIE